MKQSLSRLIISCCLFSIASSHLNAQNEDYSRPFPGYRVIGSLYAVGTYDLGVFLITSEEGHILINTGLDDSTALIRQNMQSLGFRLEDIRILLTMQAHWDHTAALAEIKNITGAEMWATAKDARVLEDGGFSDAHFGGRESFKPVQVDKIIKEGDLIDLGNIRLTVPMLFAIGFVFTFINGGLTGIFLGNVIVDVPLSDTYFVVAHFHMVMAVSPVLAVFGAVYHWYPKITGRMLDESLGKFHFWVTFVGLYCIYYPMHYLGILGVPRRYYSNGVTDFIPESAQTLNAGISIAAIIVASTQLVFLYNLAVSTTRGKPAGDNPWGATTLEWQTATTPPTHGNFGKELPLVYRWAYDYSVPGAKEDFIPQNVPASGDTGDAR